MILPEVVATRVYLVLVRIGSIWVMLIADLTGPGPHRMITTSQYVGVSAIHLALVVPLIFAGFRARRSHPSVRRGHFAGMLLALYALVLVQVVAYRFYGPIVFA